MKKSICGVPSPTANIAVNKCRVKLYKNSGEMPSYYLQKGQEFEIELFNPTQDVILAKITLNDRVVSQGGLVLNPGQRVFLDRYLDVAKKFMFDTYDVENTEEVKKAIEKNGDFKVEFYKEIIYNNYLNTKTYHNTGYNLTTNNFGYFNATGGVTYDSVSNVSSSYIDLTPTNTINTSSLNISQSNVSTNSSGIASTKPIKRSVTKSIETGRVEEGSKSDQKFDYVDKNFEYFSFHKVECKLLPVSQKINTTDDINVKRYCVNCGSKLGKTDKFCSKCGTKI